MVIVRSLPSSTSPSMAMVSSTIASAMLGSRPRTSATARKSLRTAEMTFSEAASPSWSTGVAAPMTPPASM